MKKIFYSFIATSLFWLCSTETIFNTLTILSRFKEGTDKFDLVILVGDNHLHTRVLVNEQVEALKKHVFTKLNEQTAIVLEDNQSINNSYFYPDALEPSTLRGMAAYLAHIKSPTTVINTEYRLYANHFRYQEQAYSMYNYKFNDNPSPAAHLFAKERLQFLENYWKFFSKYWIAGTNDPRVITSAQKSNDLKILTQTYIKSSENYEICKKFFKSFINLEEPLWKFVCENYKTDEQKKGFWNAFVSIDRNLLNLYSASIIYEQLTTKDTVYVFMGAKHTKYIADLFSELGFQKLHEVAFWPNINTNYAEKNKASIELKTLEQLRTLLNDPHLNFISCSDIEQLATIREKLNKINEQYLNN